MCFFQDEEAQPGLFGLEEFKSFQVRVLWCGIQSSGVTVQLVGLRHLVLQDSKCLGQEQLKPNLEGGPPNSEVLELVGSSWPMF